MQAQFWRRHGFKLLMAALALTASTLIGWRFAITLDWELQLARSEVENTLSRLDYVFAIRRQSVATLRDEAERLLAEDRAEGSGAGLVFESGLTGFLQRLPASAEPLSRAQFSGKGPVPDAQSPQRAEMVRLAPLEPVLRAIHNVDADSYRTYYLSAQEFQMRYPGDGLSYAGKMAQLEFWRTALRETFPDRSPQFTEQHQGTRGAKRSVYAPVHGPDGRLRGIVGADFTTKALEDIVQRANYPGMALFVTDSAGTVLAGRLATGRETVMNLLAAGKAIDTALVQERLPKLLRDLAEYRAANGGIPDGQFIDLDQRYIAWLPLPANAGYVYAIVPKLVIYQSTLERSLPVLILILLGVIVLVQLAQVRKRHQLAVQTSITDALTGLYNRHYIDMIWPHFIGQAARNGQHLALAILDVDHFKKYNDHNGHPAGDVVLQCVAQALQHESRTGGGDLVFRIGGEEFAVLMTVANTSHAQKVAERLCRAVAGLAMEHVKSEHGHVTVSIGLALSDAPASAHYAELYKTADAALYQAKQQGRNRVSVARAEPSVVA